MREALLFYCVCCVRGRLYTCFFKRYASSSPGTLMPQGLAAEILILEVP
jgi:hypothetical protein